jgi:uncharacterized glyoxalase superfamily protein PhnB
MPVMRSNRSMPSCTVIPVLAYDDVNAAVAWLCDAFGFTVRWQAGGHRAQLSVGDGAVVVAPRPAAGPRHVHEVMVRVEDVNLHCDRARARGVTVVAPATDYPYGERQYVAEDLDGHRWTFSETIADVPPEDWGGVSVKLD